MLSLNLVMSTVHVVDAGTAGFVYLKTPVYGLSTLYRLLWPSVFLRRRYSSTYQSLHCNLIRAIFGAYFLVLCVTNSSHSRRWLRDTNFAMYSRGDSRHFNRMPSLCMVSYRFCVTQHCNCQKVYAVTVK